jgi:hypothetical protein
LTDWKKVVSFFWIGRAKGGFLGKNIPREVSIFAPLEKPIPSSTLKPAR